MDVKLISKDKTTVEVEIPGEDETLFEPLRSALLRNPKVAVANYHAEHPWFDAKRLFVKVNEGDPLDALRKAAKEIQGEVEDAISQVEALKEP